MDFGRNSKEGKHKRNKNLWLMYAAAISASITTAGFGIIMAWTSPSLPHLKSPASQFPVSEIQGAWIASLSGCGTICGYLLNPLLIHRIGPKRTLLLLAIPQILSWILIYLGRSWILLCLARIIGGVGYGGGLCSTSAYLGKIGDRNTRGIFLVLIKMAINIGIFITMFFGAFLSYNAMNLVFLGLPIIFIVSFSFMPDTNQLEEEEDLDECVKKELKENVIDVFRENRNGVLKENRDDALKENGDNALKENRADALKENRDDVLKENRDDILEKNTVFILKETGDYVFKENTIVFKDNRDDVLQERRVDVLKENTIVVVNENVVDVLQENIMYVLNENTIDVLKEHIVDALKENTINVPNESTIHLLNENRKNGTINDTNEDLRQKGKEDTLEEEMTNLLKNIKQEIPLMESKSEKSIFWKLFCLRNNQMALLIILVSTLTDILSGHMAIVSYTQHIFEYSGASLKAEYAALVLGALKVGASLISTLVVERFGRRVLFLSTGILAGLAQGLVGLFFFLKIYLKSDVSSITWLPLFGVSLYEVAGTVGLSSLYYVYQGELFSDDVKDMGMTCTNIAYEVISFFTKFSFQIAIDAVGIYILFWGFAVCCISGSWITYWISPETKGRNKEEIQKLLGGNKKRI